jgi:hypothetical protein
MKAHDNQIAGQNVERLAAPSDGIFAAALKPLMIVRSFHERNTSHNSPGYP